MSLRAWITWDQNHVSFVYFSQRLELTEKSVVLQYVCIEYLLYSVLGMQ